MTSSPKNPTNWFANVLFLLAVVGLIVSIGGSLGIMSTDIARVVDAVALFAAALGVSIHHRWKTYAFAMWVVAFVVVALITPSVFLKFGSVELPKYVTLLVQIAMFGMGATLTLADFARVVKMPKAILVGVGLQFGVMPLLGWSLTKIFFLPPEIAIGVILVGAAPGGVSSNVITYLAKGNVALSVTLTACSTLMSPVMTPLMMYLLSGQSVAGETDYIGMFWQILFTVVAPVALGLIVNGALKRLKMASDKTDSYLAILSMIAICFICAIIAARSRDQIFQVGVVLLLTVIAHNSFGYVFGYWGSRFAGLNESDCRTVAIEVGLQNGGLAASLANDVLKSPAAAIAPAIFAPVMNVTGSILAALWSKSSIDSTGTGSTKDGKS